MNLTRITDQNRESFIHLLPEEDVKGVYSLGLLSEGNEPLAAAVFRVDKMDTALLWFYVDPGKRRNGVGSYLMDELFYILRGNTKELHCSFFSEDEEMNAFLTKNGFFVSSGDPVFCMPVKFLLHSEEINKLRAQNANKNVASMREWGNGIRTGLSRFLTEEGYDPAIMNICDKDLSFCYKDEEGHVRGCLLISRNDPDMLQIELLCCSWQGMIIRSLFRALAEAVERLDLKEAGVRFVAADEEVFKFAKSLMNDKRDPLYMMATMQHAVYIFDVDEDEVPWTGIE